MLCYACEYLPRNRSALNLIGKMVLPIVFVIKYSTIIFYIHRSYNVAIVIEQGLNKRIRSAHAAAAKKTL